MKEIEKSPIGMKQDRRTHGAGAVLIAAIIAVAASLVLGLGVAVIEKQMP